MLLCVATFRAGQVSPQTTQTLHDIGWITAFMAVPPFVVECLAIAGAILKDESPNPAFPRWLGYFNVWSAIAFTPGVLLVFFKSGAFSYQGMFVFWVPFAVFGAWIAVMAWAAGRAAAAEDPSTEPVPADGPDARPGARAIVAAASR